MRVDRQRPLQIRARPLVVSHFVDDHAGVEQQARVLGAQLQRLVHEGRRFKGPTVLEECPGSRIIAVDVLANR